MIGIAELGLTEEELQNRVIETMADRMLSALAVDDDGEEWRPPSSLKRKLDEIIKSRIDETISRMAAEHVLPRVDELIMGRVLQETNAWGEAVKKPVTFTEYLVSRAELYIQEKVDSAGKSKSESGGYSWSGTQTRLAHAINRHIGVEIENAMKAIIGDGNKQIAKAIETTCRDTIKSISEKLSISIKTQ